MPPVLCGGSGASEPGPWTLLSALAGGVLRGPGLRAWDGVACSGLAWGAELPGAWVGGAGPGTSTISRTRRLIDLETHRDVFTWIQERLAQTGLLSGKTIAIDATTLEANAADAEHRVSGYRRDLPGVLEASGEGVWHSHALSASAGAAGSAAQEERLETRNGRVRRIRTRRSPK